MGQKVNPTSFRLPINKDWRSKWFKDDESYTEFLHKDIKLREYIFNKRKNAGVARVDIKRIGDKKVDVIVYTSKMGLFIGARGVSKDELTAGILKDLGEAVIIRPVEIKKPQVVAKLIADNVAAQLVKRASFRRVMKRAIQDAMKENSVNGIKIYCSGRLGGAEMARTEWYHDGRVPLHTLRANIDYGFSEALTTYGLIGVKVLVYRDEE